MLILITASLSHQNNKKLSASFFSYCVIMKASAMTTKMVVASITAIIKQCRYYYHTGYKIIVFKFIEKRKQLYKNSLSSKF